MARFEVIGCDPDRALIHAIARRLSEDGPEDRRLRIAIRDGMAGEAPRPGRVSQGAATPAARRRGTDSSTSNRVRANDRPVNRSLLDSSMIGSITMAVPPALQQAWMAEQADELPPPFVSALAPAANPRGILEMPAGRNRKRLEVWFVWPRRSARVARTDTAKEQGPLRGAALEPTARCRRVNCP